MYIYVKIRKLYYTDPGNTELYWKIIRNFGARVYKLGNRIEVSTRKY